jgi:ATP-dependent NAD(P)H-hydrate dehydratase
MGVPKALFEQIKQLIPPLNGTLHKGQAGRVAVLGGALDYTGAPYFSAMSALRYGADMSHVICSPTAANAIKSYSPDLMVHPILREDSTHDQVRPELESILSRIHVLVIGPGLGREDYMQSYAKLALSIARNNAMFVVLDADGLYMINQDPAAIQGYRRAVLTPNVVEFKRLCQAVGVKDDIQDEGGKAREVSKVLGGVTILEKGAKDNIAFDTTGEQASTEASHVEASEKESTSEVVHVDVQGGLKRCGGQGDILSGSVGATLAWGKCYEDGNFGDGSIPSSRLPLLAAVAGSMVTRTASRLAFAKQGRGLVTADMIPEIGKSFAEVFGEEIQEGEKGRL